MRNHGIDVLRIIGITAVVLAHVYDGPVTHQWVYLWHVPLFFFLSGYFWTSGRTLRREFDTRTRSLLLPYMVWLVAGLAVLSVVGHLNWGTVTGALLGGTHASSMFGAFWFVTALFWVALLLRVLERFPSVVAWVVAIVGLAAAWVAPEAVSGLPVSIGGAVSALVFVLIGQAAARFELSPWAGALVLAMGVVLNASGWVGNIDLKFADYGTPVLGVVASSLVCWGLVSMFRGWRMRDVSTIAGAGIAVVLFHTQVLYVVGSRGWPSWAVATVVLIVSWGVAVGLRFTPLARPATGASRATFGARTGSRRSGPHGTRAPG
ncbi:acyltransferase family protein [Agromyces sp. M3QZ16-3]|uniref:acyltransferase family protein n=1 Tax=Agromyces sp. M3QZ16-3 TaxID=3447585 RepID=UPI003F68EDBC